MSDRRRDVLIAAHELAPRLEQGERLRVLDVRWELGGPDGRTEYLGGHIPGAVFVDMATELSTAGVPSAGRHPLPSLADLQAAARRWGLHDGDSVVVYDAVTSLAAARAWWLLGHAGVVDVRILDGGLAAWRRAGFDVDTGWRDIVAGTVTLVGPPEGTPWPTIDTAEAATFPSHGVLLDARAGARYRGEVEPLDPIAGHVPGAVSAPTTDNLDPDGHFLPATELAARFDALGATAGAPIAVYCGSGVTAAHEIAALAITGRRAALYPGSWSAWSNTPGLPIAIGAHPGTPAP